MDPTHETPSLPVSSPAPETMRYWRDGPREVGEERLSSSMKSAVWGVEGYELRILVSGDSIEIVVITSCMKGNKNYALRLEDSLMRHS